MKNNLLRRFLRFDEIGVLNSLILLVLIFTSCEQRDPQTEYNNLCKTVFSTPSEGEQVAQEYIDYFHNKKNARLPEVSEIRDQYRMMDAFFSNSFNNFAEFIDQSRELNYELSHSLYSGVKETWTALYKKERDRILGSFLESIKESDFNIFFQSEVRKLCEKEFNVWEIESIDQVSLSTPVLINDGTAKECHGEYLVHLRGSLVGLITEEARLSIKGMVGLHESGEVSFSRTGYEFLKKPTLK